MKKHVVVTLADKMYLDRAKQLFSSVYHNSGWNGDYLLLAHNLLKQDLAWFTSRGIHIKVCKPLYKEQRLGSYSSILASKLYIFEASIKKWDRVIYMDTDVIVRASMSQLTKIDGYHAASDYGNKPLRDQFLVNSHQDTELLTILQSSFDMQRVSFNAGMFVFQSNLITNKTFPDLVQLLQTYGQISRYGDQAIQNLYFYRRWKQLPFGYNIFPRLITSTYKVPYAKVDGAVIHFVDKGKNNKPWDRQNSFFEEWKNLRLRADELNVRSSPPGKTWTHLDMILCRLSLEISRIRLW